MNVRSTCLTVAAVLLLAPMANAAILFMDDFDGSGGPLNGTTPDVTIGGEVWESGSSWLDDGTAGTTVAGGPDGQAAHLGFTPVDGQIYTAEASVLNNNPNWIGFGFLPTAPGSGDWTQTSFSVRHSNAPGYAWLLNRNSTGNDQEGFLGGGTGGGQSWNGDNADPTNPVNVKIVLNTMAANWTAEWSINGTTMGSGPVAFGAAGNPGIGGIGFSHDRNAAANSGGVIGNFSLSVVPEPAAGLLAMIGMLGLAASRRRA